MTGPLRLTLAAVLLLAAAACSPHDTRLPFKLEDIPKVQKQLDKLPAEERQLVLDYLKRSKGDVVPAKYADPDQPFTARTFGEAIELQRAWRVKHPAEAVDRAKAQAAREAAMEPLRRTLGIGIARREIVLREQAAGLPRAAGGSGDEKQVLVTTYWLRNASSDAITHFSGLVTVRVASGAASPVGEQRCSFNRGDELPPGESIEVRCGELGREVTDADRMYVELPASALAITWEPRSITFASGRTMMVAQ
jgi:hypothetical protein